MQEGWYPDPMGQAAHRWFDGTTWTTAVLDAEGRAVEPALSTGAPSAPAMSPPPQTTASAPSMPIPSDWNSPPPGMTGATLASPTPSSAPMSPAPAPSWAQPAGAGAPAAVPAWTPASGVSELAWLWTVLGVLTTALCLTVLSPSTDFTIGFTAAGFFAAWGVSSTRSNPGWGLLRGAAGAGIAFLNAFYENELYGDNFFAEHERLGLAIYLTPSALILSALPALAGAPRVRAMLGAVLGVAGGVTLAVFLPHSAYESLYEASGTKFNLATPVVFSCLLLAPLGALAVGGRARRSPKHPRATAQGGQYGYPPPAP